MTHHAEQTGRFTRTVETPEPVAPHLIGPRPAEIVPLDWRRWQPWRLALLPVLVAVLVGLGGGCRPSSDDARESRSNADSPPPKLKLIVADDEALADQIARQWQARGAGELQVETTTVDALLAQRRIRADMVIFPSRHLGALAVAKQIESWSKSSVEGGAGRRDPDVFSLERFRETTWGPTPYAVSFGSPQFVLYLRKDRLAELRLERPATWSAYATLVDRLEKQRKLAGESAARFAVAEPLGPGWAAMVLLARAAPYVRHGSQFSDLFDFVSLEPLIAEPPYVRALEELVAAAKHAPPEVLQADPVQVKQWFYEGKVAVAWSWPTPTFDIAQQVKQPIDMNLIELSELPGSQQAFLFEQGTWETRGRRESPHVPLIAMSGRLGAVVRGTPRRQAAAAALRWLTSREFGVVMSSASRATTGFRQSHRNDPTWLDQGMPLTLASQYGRVLMEAQNRNLALSVPRIPGCNRYLEKLDQAVRRAVEDGADPRECLEQVAREWSELTEQLGRGAQLKAYRQSLGLEQ